MSGRSRSSGKITILSQLRRSEMRKAQISFKVPDIIWQSFDSFRARKGLPLSATNYVELSVKEVSFGDGTGYEYGRPYPRYPTSGMNQPSKVIGIGIDYGASTVQRTANHVSLKAFKAYLC
jgi:hypothetical protein